MRISFKPCSNFYCLLFSNPLKTHVLPNLRGFQIRIVYYTETVQRLRNKILVIFYIVSINYENPTFFWPLLSALTKFSKNSECQSWGTEASRVEWVSVYTMACKIIRPPFKTHNFFQINPNDLNFLRSWRDWFAKWCDSSVWKKWTWSK